MHNTHTENVAGRRGRHGDVTLKTMIMMMCETMRMIIVDYSDKDVMKDAETK